MLGYARVPVVMALLGVLRPAHPQQVEERAGPGAHLELMSFYDFNATAQHGWATGNFYPEQLSEWRDAWSKWKMHGKKAGPLRNQEMVDAGTDLVVAFPGGRGTADLVRRARAAGLQILVVS